MESAHHSLSAPQMSPFLPFELLFQQSHLFLLCVVLTCNDSRKDLHRLCQIPRNCQCKRLLVPLSAPGTFPSSFVSPEKFLICTGRTVTVLPSLVPPRHIDGCSAIHCLHLELCDLQQSNHRNFSALSMTALARLLQEGLVISVFKHISKFGSFGKCVNTLCVPEPGSTYARGSIGGS